MRNVIRLLLPFFATLWYLSTADLAAAQGRERNFESLKLRYKLPGEDWSWNDENVPPNAAFVATNGEGFLVVVSYLAMPKPAGPLNQEWVNGFESKFFQKPKMQKRGGRFMTFLDRPCYQAEGVLEDGRTVINRVLFGSNHVYNFMIIGGVEPVEKSAGFEAIVNGLTLNSPPPPNIAPPEGPADLGRQVGQATGSMLVIIFVIVVVVWLSKKKPAKP